MKVNFIKSAQDPKGYPQAKLPEYAFVGRSNVGKSSLINMLADAKGLAKTSSTPGKTRLLNFFSVDDQWILVDVPGYGFAKISKSQREHWGDMVRDYVLKRQTLLYTFVLVDSRLKPQKSDTAFLEWLGENNLPFALVFTKADKLSRNKVHSNVAAYKRALLEKWEELPPIFITSSEEKTGKAEILNFITGCNSEYGSLVTGAFN